MTGIRTARIALLLAIVVALGSLATAGCRSEPTYDKYSYQFFGTFDTVIQFMGYAKGEKEFQTFAKAGEARFQELHRLFDIYNDYPGVQNVKTINDQAGIAPVEVDDDLIRLILLSREWYGKTGGKVNIALGPVLAIWHRYRDAGIADPSAAALPDYEELAEAATRCDLSKVVVDEEKGTVFLPEKGMRLDLGAVAKGYACEVVAQELKAAGLTSVIVNGGGNIRIVGRPMDGRQRWGVGIQNPDGDAQDPGDTPLDIVFLYDTSFVTSGDYQRFYEVAGKRFCHLIDPDTLMPATYYRSVAVTYHDSAIADFLSSTLFLLPYEESRALAERIDGLEAVWIFEGNRMEATPGMRKWMKDLGGASSSLS